MCMSLTHAALIGSRHFSLQFVQDLCVIMYDLIYGQWCICIKTCTMHAPRCILCLRIASKSMIYSAFMDCCVKPAAHVEMKLKRNEMVLYQFYSSFVSTRVAGIIIHLSNCMVRFETSLQANVAG
jgi:hypothetical protein